MRTTITAANLSQVVGEGGASQSIRVGTVPDVRCQPVQVDGGHLYPTRCHVSVSTGGRVGTTLASRLRRGSVVVGYVV